MGDNAPAPAREEDFDLETYGIMQNVKMKPAQYRHLVESYGEETAKEVIDDFSCKLADGSTDSANHFATIVSWLGYRRRMGAGSVPLSSTSASRYAKPAPADDPKRASREERIQWAKDLWEQVSEDERQDYINRYNCYPWERGDI